MSHFFAEFDRHGTPPCFIRKNTRVYFHAQQISPGTLKPLGKCVGAIWMCNPGSAGWPPQQSSWGAIPADPTLRRVLDLYKAAVADKNEAVKPHDYLAVLNCFYSVGPDPEVAYEEWRRSRCSYKESVCQRANFVVVAWGLDAPLGPARAALNEIESWSRESAVRVVVYIDPTLPSAASKVGNELSGMYYPSHPNSRAFRDNMADMALSLTKVILSDSDSEDVLDLDE